MYWRDFLYDLAQVLNKRLQVHSTSFICPVQPMMMITAAKYVLVLRCRKELIGIVW